MGNNHDSIAVFRMPVLDFTVELPAELRFVYLVIMSGFHRYHSSIHT